MLKRNTKEEFNLYRLNFYLIGIFTLIRIVEIIFTIISINLGATEIGILGRYNIPLAIFLTIIPITYFIILNYKMPKECKIFLFVSIFVLLGITIWNFSQIVRAINYYK